MRREVWALAGKPGSQAQAAEFFYNQGVLETPNQTAVSRWERMKVFSRTILEKFECLREIGVNPDFLRYSHVTSWKITPEATIDATEVIRLRAKIRELEEETQKYKEANRKLIGLLTKMEDEDTDA